MVSCKKDKIVINDIAEFAIPISQGVILGYNDILVETDSCIYFPKKSILYLRCLLMDHKTKVTLPDGFAFLIVKNGILNDTVATIKDEGLLEGKFKFEINDTLLISSPHAYSANYYWLKKEI